VFIEEMIQKDPANRPEDFYQVAERIAQITEKMN
jgi:hypothetical protein